MKLLEKLAPYLPYDLKIVAVDHPQMDFVMHPVGGTGRIGILEVIERPKLYKPALYPLTNNDIIPINNHKNKWCIMAIDEIDNQLTYVEISPNTLNLLLFKHHIDVFGMIASGEAIDINRIKNLEN